MDDIYNEIDATLLPGMMDMNVQEALEKAESLCVEMRESAAFCKRLLDRLLFLRTYLPTRKSKMNSPADFAKVMTQFANTLGLVIRFFKSHSDKKLLQRIAGNRLVVKEVERLHSKIDGVFQAVRLANSTEMNEWKEHKVNDIAQLLRTLEESSHNMSNLVSGLSGSALEEALTELQFEIDPLKNQNKFRVFLKRVLDAVVAHVPDAQIPTIPAWYIRRDDVEIGDQIDIGVFGAVHKAKWGDGETEVVMKLLYLDGYDTQRSFLREENVWHDLNHPYVIKMLGGCHVGKPLFFVSERAMHGNFTDYLYHAENKSKLWRLFHQAAQGLAYLHGQCIVHSDIKCNNILVGDDNAAKLCDFGFSYIRTLSVGKIIKEQPSATRWKAPECLLEQGDAANPSFKSDVFSLGMSIIEAKIGGVPWGVMSDDEIIDELVSGEGYPRPEGVFTDKEWDLVQGMTAFDPEKRITLLQVIETLDELAKDQEAEEEHIKQVLKGLGTAKQKEPEPVETEPVKTVTLQTIECWSCHQDTPAINEFCGKCGAALEHLERMLAPVVFESLPADPAPHQMYTQEKSDVANRDSSELIVELPHFPAEVTSNEEQRSRLTELVASTNQARELNIDTASAEDRALHVLRAIERNKLKLEQMWLEARENGALLKLLVAALVRALTSIASDAVQRDEADIASLEELYAGLHSTLEQLSSAPTNIFYRIASSRHVLQELESLREKLIDLTHLATTTESEDNDWKNTWSERRLIREAQLATQLEQTRDLSEVLPDRISQIEALVTLKYELNIDPSQDLVSIAYNKVSGWFKIEGLSVQDWFLPRYEVTFDASGHVGDGTFGAVYYGSWCTRLQTGAVKVLLMYGLGGALAQASFMEGVALWYGLEPHKHVLKLYGASHVGQRAFVVLEQAEKGNLLMYLSDPENRPNIWKLLYQAAKGLMHLHEHGIIHGHLKCSNILISGDEKAKLTDFGFDGIRNAINALGYSNISDSLQWTAPELLLNNGETPSHSSDVFSLGMCFIESLVRGPPWGECADTDLLEKIELHELPARPANTPDRVWKLIREMCAFKPSDRKPLQDVLVELYMRAHDGQKTRTDPVRK